MDRARLELFPGFWLDARRAVWMEKEQALLVADLHLGYAWAHRQRGNLMPINGADDTLDRLQALAIEYAPRKIIVLGDIIHAAVAEEAVLADLRLLNGLGASVSLIAGNHDRQLAPMLRRAGIDCCFAARDRAGWPPSLARRFRRRNNGRSVLRLDRSKWRTRHPRPRTSRHQPFRWFRDPDTLPLLSPG